MRMIVLFVTVENAEFVKQRDVEIQLSTHSVLMLLKKDGWNVFFKAKAQSETVVVTCVRFIAFDFNPLFDVCVLLCLFLPSACEYVKKIAGSDDVFSLVLQIGMRHYAPFSSS